MTFNNEGPDFPENKDPEDHQEKWENAWISTILEYEKRESEMDKKELAIFRALEPFEFLKPEHCSEEIRNLNFQHQLETKNKDLIDAGITRDYIQDNGDLIYSIIKKNILNFYKNLDAEYNKKRG